MIFLWILLLGFAKGATLDPRSNWFNSSCQIPSNCNCYPQDGYECIVNASSSANPSCYVPHSIVSLTVICSEYRLCEAVEMHLVLSAFPNVRRIRIFGCRVDFSWYDVDRHSSNVSFREPYLSRKRGDKTPFALYLETVLELNDMIKRKPPPPLCVLYSLVIQNAQLQVLPVGFLYKCKYLELLVLNRNNLTEIHSLDLATLISLPLLRLELVHNKIAHISDNFTALAMDKVKKFMKNDLLSWFDDHYPSLNEQERHGFKFLIDNCSALNNDAPLMYEELVKCVKKGGIEDRLFFIVNRSPLNFLILSHNHLQKIPSSLFGYNSLFELNITNNRIEMTLLHNFFAFRQSLEFLWLNDNVIGNITNGSLHYLGRVGTISLSYNLIMQVSPDAFPQGNIIKRLYLANNKLRLFEIRPAMKHLEELDLSNNQIENLSNIIMPNLAYLAIGNNSFQQLEPFSLYNLSKLVILDLTENSLVHVPEKPFRMQRKGSQGGRTLVNITGSNKTTMICDCYSVFLALKEESNEEHRYTYPRFVGYEGLTCKHGVDDIKHPINFNYTFPCVFKNFTRLQNCSDVKRDCNLTCPTGCYCTYFRDHVKYMRVHCTARDLTTVPILTTRSSVLFLDENQIKSIHRRSFASNYKYVTALHLQNSQLTVLEARTFEKLPRLLILNLSCNPIHTIHPYAFHSLETLDTLLMDDTEFVLSLDPFVNLIALSYLRLVNITLNCSCHTLLDFLAFRAQGGNKSILRIDMPNSCYWGPPYSVMTPLTDLKHNCTVMNREAEAAARRRREHIHIGVFTGVALLIVVLAVATLVCHRHHIRAGLDAAVDSLPLRLLLRLTPPNRSCAIDVAIIAHEAQSNFYRLIRRRLQSSQRAALRSIRMAPNMPGAVRLAAAPLCADDVAVFVLLLSPELLDETSAVEMEMEWTSSVQPSSVQTLKSLLTRHVERPKERRLSLLPVMVDAQVKSHKDWPELLVLLRPWRPLLHWDASTFWDRLLPALPAPIEQYSEDCGPPPPPPLSPLQLSFVLPCLAQLCVISDEEQKAGPVRCIFDRYRGSLELCSLRRGQLYGVPAPSAQHLSLLEALLRCQQVAVVVSESLLQERWTRHKLIPALYKRFRRLPFRGTLLLLERGGQLAENDSYLQLRENPFAVPLPWDAVQNNWEILEQHLVEEDTSGPELVGMDEEEFEALLSRPCSRLIDMDENDGLSCPQRSTDPPASRTV